MTMGFKATVRTSFSTIGTTLGTIDSTAQYAKNFVDEALEVQQETRHLRVAKSVLEAKKDLAQDVAILTDKEKQIIAELESAVEPKTKPTK